MDVLPRRRRASGVLARRPPRARLLSADVRALVLLHWGRERHTLWVDGLIAALAVGAVGVAVVFEAVLEAVEGERLAIVTVNLAYPLADTILLGLVVGALAASGWRVSRTWALLAGGVALFAVFHFVYSTRWRSAPTRSARQSIWGRSPPRS